MKPEAAISLSVIIVVIVIGTLLAHGQTLFTPGKFPQGQFYVESELSSLAGQKLPDPSYLVGRFVYVTSQGDLKIFVPYSEGMFNNGILPPRIVIGVKFFNNVPPTLGKGQMIVPTKENPLTIKSIKQQDQITLVIAESWSTQ